MTVFAVGCVPLLILNIPPTPTTPNEKSFFNLEQPKPYVREY